MIYFFIKKNNNNEKAKITPKSNSTLISLS